MICYILVLLFSILICVGPILLNHVVSKEDWCGLQLETATVSLASESNRKMVSGDFGKSDSSESPYANPDYILDPCRYLRVPHLCYLTMEECDVCRRLLCSVILGAIIG